MQEKGHPRGVDLGLSACVTRWKRFLVLKDPFLSRSFGMVHDGEGNVCKKSEGNIMSPTLAGRNGVFSWSACSRQYLHKFLRYEPLKLVVSLSMPLKKCY